MNYYRNRLVKVINKDGEIKSEFSYDILGRRISKETEDSIIKYTYSSSDVIQEDVYEKDDGKIKLEETKENIYGKGVDDVIASIVKKDKKSKTYFFHKNQLGSIVAITDEKGNIVEEYKYDVFGKAYIRNGKSDNWREFKESKIGNERLFTGREYDKEIGLYYYRARYYSADLGRFISRDPIGQVDDINLYSYVGNNSVRYVDSMGLEKALITEKFIVSIFDLAMENTGGFDIYQIYYGTKNSGPYDIKRSPYIAALAEKNGGTIDFNGVQVEPSNLGNLLFGMNVENNYIPSSLSRSILMDYEIANAKLEGYGIYSEEVAKWDENSDSIWYDKGENIYSEYIKTTTLQGKINLITSAINSTNLEYSRRYQTETYWRNYYEYLLTK